MELILFGFLFCFVNRRIGTVARMELQKVLNATVHLVLDVKVMSEQSYSSPFEDDLLSHQVL
jgi:GTPase Era involved in 16S rRNA processing